MNCNYCKYTTKIKCNYQKHLSSNKHKKMYEEYKAGRYKQVGDLGPAELYGTKFRPYGEQLGQMKEYRTAKNQTAQSGFLFIISL